MFTKQEIVAMAWGYGFAIPAAAAAIYFSASPLAAVPILMLGFVVTLWRLNNQ